MPPSFDYYKIGEPGIEPGSSLTQTRRPTFRLSSVMINSYAYKPNGYSRERTIVSLLIVSSQHKTISGITWPIGSATLDLELRHSYLTPGSRLSGKSAAIGCDVWCKTFVVEPLVSRSNEHTRLASSILVPYSNAWHRLHCHHYTLNHRRPSLIVCDVALFISGYVYTFRS